MLFKPIVAISPDIRVVFHPADFLFGSFFFTAFSSSLYGLLRG